MSKTKCRTSMIGLAVAIAGATAAAVIAFVPEITSGVLTATGTARTVVLATPHVATIAGLILALHAYATECRHHK